MNELNPIEASFFLLLLSANFKRDPITDSINGELSEKAEKLILKCVNKLPEFTTGMNSQKDIEDAIEKYNDLKDVFCTSTAEIIQHCAKPLLGFKSEKEVVYYLCIKLVYLNGIIKEGSEEEKYVSKLNYYLNIDSNFSDALGFVEIVNTTLDS